MLTKRELHQELERLREQLKSRDSLKRQAAAKAEDMIALREQYEALKTELMREFRRSHNRIST
jgi:hypothetical protein